MTIKAVTFDFHNTLAVCDDWFALEVRELVPELLARLALRDGIAVDRTRCEQARQAYRVLRAEVAATGLERDAVACALATLLAIETPVAADVVTALVDELMREALAHTQPVPGALEAVRELRRQGIRCAVVSSAVHHDFVAWTIERFGLRDAFVAIVTSASAGYYKSRPEIYTTALDYLGAAPEEAVHVGDSYRFDVQGARRAGMRAIWFASTEQVLAHGADEAAATIGDLATLPSVIASLNGASRRRLWQR
ncbi:MAG: HAD family hydrolase [Thermomicrobiales bacterium]